MFSYSDGSFVNFDGLSGRTNANQPAIVGARKLPHPRVDAGTGNQADSKATPPDQNLFDIEMMNELKRVVDRLKPGDRMRGQALIDAGGDRGLAAKSLGLETGKFNAQFRQTVRPNLKKEMQMLEREEGE